MHATEKVDAMVRAKCAEARSNKFQLDILPSSICKLSKSQIFSLATRCTFCRHCGCSSSYGLLFPTPCKCVFVFQDTSRNFEALRNYHCRYCRKFRMSNGVLNLCDCLLNFAAELDRLQEWRCILLSVSHNLSLNQLFSSGHVSTNMALVFTARLCVTYLAVHAVQLPWTQVLKSFNLLHCGRWHSLPINIG